MKKLFNSNRFRIALILIVVIIVGGISLYSSRSTKLLDKEVYSAFRSAVSEVAESGSGGFADQQELKDFIKSWADEHSLE